MCNIKQWIFKIRKYKRFSNILKFLKITFKYWTIISLIFIFYCLIFGIEFLSIRNGIKYLENENFNITKWIIDVKNKFQLIENEFELLGSNILVHFGLPYDI